ncbi:MAG TPA: hypothetical protein VF363_07155 [Candidatus Eisenbacteria bacterium]|jgi:hypothetical protein
MKKLLTLTLVFVFALALVFALGCNKKQEEPASSTESGMEQTTPPAGGMADSTAAMPDTSHGTGAMTGH